MVLFWGGRERDQGGAPACILVFRAVSSCVLGPSVQSSDPAVPQAPSGHPGGIGDEMSGTQPKTFQVLPQV